MYRKGFVTEVDADRCRAKVKFPDKQDRESGWLDVLQANTQENKGFELPDAGEFVAVMMDERDEAGCILGALYTEANKPTDGSPDLRRMVFSDGTVIEYNRTASLLRVAGPVAVHIESAGVVTIDPAVECKATLKVGTGASPVALATPLAALLSAFKAAVGAAVIVPLDGGASFKAAMVAAMAGWPGSLGATNTSSD
jgi:phage baseplate assembly protein V